MWCVLMSLLLTWLEQVHGRPGESELEGGQRPLQVMRSLVVNLKPRPKAQRRARRIEQDLWGRSKGSAKQTARFS